MQVWIKFGAIRSILTQGINQVFDTIAVDVAIKEIDWWGPHNTHHNHHHILSDILAAWTCQQSLRLYLSSRLHLDPFPTLLRRDQDHTVCADRAIQSARCRTFQHRYGLNVIGIDVRSCVTIIVTPTTRFLIT